MTHEERVYFRIEAAISHEEKINHKYRMCQSYTAATSQEESDDEENKTHDGQ